MTRPTFAGYRATREADGTLVVHDVPIFVECSRGDNVFDLDWIQQAVAKAQQAEAEGYLPPLHVRHHTGTQGLHDPVRPAGFFRITGLRLITFKGDRRTAVLADLHLTDPAVREDVLARRLPYRSVEIFDVDNPGLDSLALLDHEAPYLELPMLMVADVMEDAPADSALPGATPGTLVRLSRSVANATFDNPWLRPESQRGQGLVACFQRGKSAHLLFEDHMSKTNKKAEFACKPEERMQEDAEKDKPEGENMAEGAMDVGAIVSAIKDGTISVADMEAIMAAIQERSAGATPEAEDMPMEPAEVPAQAMAKGDAADMLARLAGENQAMRARLDARDREDELRANVDAAMQTLAGRPLGGDLKARLAAFHRDHGAKAFAAYVESMASTFARLSAHDHTATAFASQVEHLPAVAMSYSKDGTEAVDRAARFAREWQELSQRGLTRASQERYVQVSMARSN